MGRTHEEINPAGDLRQEMQEVNNLDLAQERISDGASFSGQCSGFFTILCC